tara:strand:+ start:71 stop:550 length:480 start_codon:yes stop_codon:yes gene_type:complete
MMQCFTGIDVAHAGHDLLVQQGGLDAATPTKQLPGKYLGREGITYRLRPQLPQRPMRHQLIHGDAFHAPESTWIVVHEQRTIGHRKYHMVMSIELGWPIAQHAECPAHPKVADQCIPVRQLDDEILAATCTADDAAAPDTINKVILKRPTQAGAAQLDG